MRWMTVSQSSEPHGNGRAPVCAFSFTLNYVRDHYFILILWIFIFSLFFAPSSSFNIGLMASRASQEKNTSASLMKNDQKTSHIFRSKREMNNEKKKNELNW